eukprot:242008_1
MLSNRPIRTASANASKRLKLITDETISLRRIYQGDIRYMKYAYINPDAEASIGNDKKGQLFIGSPPMYDRKTDDYGADAIFANNKEQVLWVKAANLLVDDGYSNHMHQLKEQKPNDIGTDLLQSLTETLELDKKSKKKYG